MDANVSSDRIAVLIDADNTRPSYAEALLSEVAKYGTPEQIKANEDVASILLGAPLSA